MFIHRSRFYPIMFLNNIKFVVTLVIILLWQFCFVGCEHIMQRVKVNLIDSMTLNCSHHQCRSPLHQASLCVQDPTCMASWAPRGGGDDCLLCKCPAQLPGSIATETVSGFYIAYNGDVLPGNCQWNHACVILEVSACPGHGLHFLNIS